MPDVTQHPIFEPDGAITVYKNVPLDKSYEHSVNYSTQAAFVTALSTYTHTTLSNQSYSRLTQNSVRVELSFSYLKDCNYMMITDANLYGGKVYFCFIDTVEYINNVTCDIFFTIDVLQTYYHDFTMRENFVEREHCLLSDDVIGKNLVPESLELGEQICHWKSGKYYLRSQGVYTVILYTPNMLKESGGDFVSDKEYVIYDGSALGVTTTTSLPAEQLLPLVRNQFGGVVLALPIQMHINDTTRLAADITSIQMAINMILRTEGSIIDIFQINGEIYNDNFASPPIPVANSIRDFNCNEQNSFKKLDGTWYSNIKNKKLLQYPFKKLVVSNNNGSTNEYQWELFTTRDGNNVQAQFSYFNVMLPEPKAYIYPNYYRGLDIDYENGLILEDFPKMCWTEDSYSRWWAQNKTSFALSLISQSLMTALTFNTGGLSTIEGVNKKGQEVEKTSLAKSGAFTLGMGAMGIARTMSKSIGANNTPDTTHIQDNSSSIKWVQDRLGWTFYDMGITGEMAEIIDKYFEMFGYATHKVKIPNFISNSRPVWDYVKLQACQIEARTSGVGLNGEYIDQIQSIFNNGITLWKSLANVGNYSLDNHTA